MPDINPVSPGRQPTLVLPHAHCRLPNALVSARGRGSNPNSIYEVFPLLVRGPPLWQDYCNAHIDEGDHIKPEWNLVEQSAPDFDVDPRINW